MKQSYLITLVTGIILIFVSPTRADSSGPNSPDSAADQGDWNNPTNVFSSDDSRADHSGTNQHILRAYDFKFSIPAGATINGFYVEIEGYGSEPNPARRRINVALAKSGYTVEGSWKTGDLPYTVGAETYINFGGAIDLWNGSWIASDVNSSDFSVLLRDNDTDGDKLFADHIRITVHYTSASGGNISYTRRTRMAED
jgi:hypothetical protein